MLIFFVKRLKVLFNISVAIKNMTYLPIYQTLSQRVYPILFNILGDEETTQKSLEIAFSLLSLKSFTEIKLAKGLTTNPSLRNKILDSLTESLLYYSFWQGKKNQNSEHTFSHWNFYTFSYEVRWVGYLFYKKNWDLDKINKVLKIEKAELIQLLARMRNGYNNERTSEV